MFRKIFKPTYLFLLRPSIRYRLIPMFDRLFRYSEKEDVINKALAYVDFTHVPGDYFEFGVWKGRTFRFAYFLSKQYKRLEGMHFYGFDSFEGLPEKRGLDAKTPEFKKGEYMFGLEDLERLLKKQKVDLSRTTFIKGWFEDTLNEKTRSKLKAKSASVIYIDSDLYESAVLALDFITPYMVDGTVILFDDWHCFKGRSDMGEQRAFSEWLRKNKRITATEFRRFNWSGNSFILHKNE